MEVVAQDQSTRIKQRTGKSKTHTDRATCRTVIIELELLNNIDTKSYNDDIDRIEYEISILVSESNPPPGIYTYTFSFDRDGTILNPQLEICHDPISHIKVKSYLENYIAFNNK